MTATVITITSGKGGVGKTTTSAAFAAALALRGKKTVVVDFDVGLRNLDLALGIERRVIYDMIQVIEGRAKLNQALIRDKRVPNLSILPTSQTREKEALTLEGVTAIIEQLKTEFDYIVCDSPAGIEHGAVMAMYHADHAIVVTNPEISSVRDSDRMLGLIAARSKRAVEDREPVQEHLLITRYDPDRVASGEMLAVPNVVEILSADLLGIIPESKAVLRASNTGTPVSIDDTTDAGRAYREAVSRFLGEPVDPPAVPDKKPRGFFARLFGRS